jgi:hypothetical protein
MVGEKIVKAIDILVDNKKSTDQKIVQTQMMSVYGMRKDIVSLVLWINIIAVFLKCLSQ